MLAALLMSSVSMVCGCGSDAKMAAVEGIVRLDGEPVPTGMVYFTPPVGRSAAGQIQSDGTFRLSTFTDGDGAAVGTHAVSVVAFAGGSSSVTPGSEEVSERTSLVPLHYTLADSSGLTFDVKPGVSNFAELDLKSE